MDPRGFGDVMRCKLASWRTLRPASHSDCIWATNGSLRNCGLTLPAQRREHVSFAIAWARAVGYSGLADDAGHGSARLAPLPGRWRFDERPEPLGRELNTSRLMRSDRRERVALVATGIDRLSDTTPTPSRPLSSSRNPIRYILDDSDSLA